MRITTTRITLLTPRTVKEGVRVCMKLFIFLIGSLRTFYLGFSIDINKDVRCLFGPFYFLNGFTIRILITECNWAMGYVITNKKYSYKQFSTAITFT